MTSRERVRRCLDFLGPDRCPVALPSPYPNDLCTASITDDLEWKPYRVWQLQGVRQWEDEWHNVWQCLPNTTRGLVIEGAIEDWSALGSYKMPRMDLPERYEQARQTFENNVDRYHIGFLPGFPFAIMRYLRKMETFLEDILLHPEEVRQLQRRVVDLLKRCMEQWARVDSDGVMFAEDWGMQDRLLIAPRVWHDVFEWGFRELVSHARTLSLDVWMHSCGCIREILPTLVDLGIKVFQLDQPKLSGLDYLAEICHGKSAVWSPVDIQQDLPKGDEAHIRCCARALVEKLGGRGGGFICGYYGDPRSLGIDPQWQMWAVDEFARCTGSN